MSYSNVDRNTFLIYQFLKFINQIHFNIWTTIKTNNTNETGKVTLMVFYNKVKYGSYIMRR